jgi:hypothetical protein
LCPEVLRHDELRGEPFPLNASGLKTQDFVLKEAPNLLDTASRRLKTDSTWLKLAIL